MSKFQAISIVFGTVCLGLSAIFLAFWIKVPGAVAFFVGLSSLIASGFAAAAGDK